MPKHLSAEISIPDGARPLHRQLALGISLLVTVVLALFEACGTARMYGSIWSLWTFTGAKRNESV
jgi:hypothetical protein